MKKIVILQNRIMEYRRPVFDRLADYYDVLVVHAGAPSTLSKFRETLVPARQVGPFFLQDPFHVRQAIKDAHTVIAMFDLRWPAYLWPNIRTRGQYIVWGHRYSRSEMGNAIRDRLMRRADKMLMYSAEDIDRMISRGIDANRIHIAHNTIHVPNHGDLSSTPKNSIIFVGRLQPRKRIEDVIDIFASLRSTLPNDTVLDIVGDGQLQHELIDRAAAQNMLPRVRFHGEVTDHDRLRELFSKATAYISPGPVGLGVLHSFAYGVPVITLRNERHGPEFTNLVHNQNAILCADSTGLAEAIKTVCNDTAATRSLHANAYKQYLARTLDIMIDGFRNAIDF